MEPAQDQSEEQNTSAQPNQPTEQKACPYYPKGTCRMGDSCNWLHVGDPGAPKGQPVSDQEVCPFFDRGKCNYGNTCKWVHPGTHNQEPCPYFGKGKCYYGTACKFKHVGGVPDQGFAYPPFLPQMAYSMLPHLQALAQLGFAPQSVLPGPAPGTPGAPGYPFPGYPFTYVPPDVTGYGAVPTIPVARTPDSSKTCRYWQQGQCPYENCRYSHQGPPGGGGAGVGPGTGAGVGIGVGGGLGIDSLKRPGRFSQDEQLPKRAKIELPSMMGPGIIGVPPQIPLQYQQQQQAQGPGHNPSHFAGYPPYYQ